MIFRALYRRLHAWLIHAGHALPASARRLHG